ncbi:unnamed protein product, partial [Effrenium voratum]
DMTELYVQHMVKAEGLDPDLLQYIYESSGGNPSGVEIVVSELRKSSRIQVREGRLELMEGMRLRREYPEALIGIALAAFEQLKPLQQDLVKNIAMCSQEADAEVLNLEDLAEALEWDFDQLQQDCARLVTQGVFRPVMPLPKRMTRRNLASGSQSSLTFTPSAGNSPARGARRLPSDMELCAISFGSQLLRHVVLSLVLHSQTERIRSKLPDEQPEPREESGEGTCTTLCCHLVVYLMDYHHNITFYILHLMKYLYDLMMYDLMKYLYDLMLFHYTTS